MANRKIPVELTNGVSSVDGDTGVIDLSTSYEPLGAVAGLTHSDLPDTATDGHPGSVVSLVAPDGTGNLGVGVTDAQALADAVDALTVSGDIPIYDTLFLFTANNPTVDAFYSGAPVGLRIALTNQTDTAENGFYVMNGTNAPDFTSLADFGKAIFTLVAELPDFAAMGSEESKGTHTFDPDSLVESGWIPHEVKAQNVLYDNSTSGLTADEVSAALDELAATPSVAAFADLTDVDVTTDPPVDGDFFTWDNGELVPITFVSEEILHADQPDLATSGHPAEIISYDPTVSGLAATQTQAAIDELAAGGSGGGNSYRYLALFTANMPTTDAGYAGAPDGFVITFVAQTVTTENGFYVMNGTATPTFVAFADFGSATFATVGAQPDFITPKTDLGAHVFQYAEDAVGGFEHFLSVDVDSQNVYYDGTSSGLAATDVQAAVDELASTPSASSLGDLTDVDLTTDAPADADVLAYNSATDTWVPASLLGAATPGLTPPDGSGNLSTDVDSPQKLLDEVDALTLPASKITSGVFVRERFGAGSDGSGDFVVTDDGYRPMPSSVKSLVSANAGIPSVDYLGSINVTVGVGTASVQLFEAVRPIIVNAASTVVFSAGSAGALARLGLWSVENSSADSVVATLAVDFNTVTCDTTGTKTAVLGSPMTLPAGTYATGLVSSHSVVFTCATGSGGVPSMRPKLIAGAYRSLAACFGSGGYPGEVAGFSSTTAFTSGSNSPGGTISSAKFFPVFLEWSYA